jgi:hypothetical protein
VDFHQPGFVATANGENAFRAEKGFWFQLGDDDRQQAKSPWGPANPQALNRYAYVLNNPVRYFDIIFLEERFDLSSGEGYGSYHYSNPYPACGAFGGWKLFGLVRHISSS